MSDIAIKALVGRRIEIPVHYDLWMRGARTGTITSTRGDCLLVKMDHPQVRRRVKVWAMDWPYVKTLAD